MSELGYWAECISDAADGCGLQLTAEQLAELADGVRIAHEQYSMAFYSPPSTDRLSEIERRHEEEASQIKARLERAEEGAKTAIRRALGIHSDALISITDDGEVYRHEGRTEQIL